MPNLRHAGHNRGSLEIAAYCRQGAQAPFRANDSSSCRPSPFTPLLSAGPPIGIASLSAATIPSPSIGVHRVMAMHRGTAEAHLRGRLWEPRYNRGAPETRDLAVYSAPGRAGGNGCCRSAFLGCAGGGFHGRRARHQFLTLIGRRRHATLRIGERSESDAMAAPPIPIGFRNWLKRWAELIFCLIAVPTHSLSVRSAD